jgi:hypothetical protein
LWPDRTCDSAEPILSIVNAGDHTGLYAVLVAEADSI